MNEFDLIDTVFKPLSLEFSGSLGLTDDAALIDIPAEQELIITKDAISEGIHFIGTEDASLIARKLLRTNLSDLAAMGAAPLCYFLAVMLPGDTTEAWIQRFANGLAEDQAEYGIHLAGGDTIATRGPRSFSLTALGTVLKGKALRRSGARPGDGIYVSGTLGDSALGLDCLQGRLPADDFLQQRYFLPQPRRALGQRLLGFASACIDISDGLLQDLAHLCRASGVGAEIRRDCLPLSSAASRLIALDPTRWERIISGGDDYELLFTAPPEKDLALAALSQELGLPLTCIGTMIKSNGVDLLDEKNRKLPINHVGFKHFL